MIEQVPDLYDGGYWYVVSANPSGDGEGFTPGILFPHYTAWYGAAHVLVRVTAPVSGVPVATIAPEEVIAGAVEAGALQENEKPFGRTGGL